MDLQNGNVQTAIIAASASLSGGVGLGTQSLVGVWMPAAWTSASMTFQVSPDGGTTWLELYNSSGTETAFTVAAGEFIQVDPAQWRGINMVKVRSGTAASPVNQSVQASIGLVTRFVS